MTKTTRFGLLAVALLGSFSLFADDMLVEDTGKVFSGETGIRVTMVRVKPLKANLVLVQMTGAESEADGQVLLHEINEWDGNADYKMKWEGRDYTTITMREFDGHKRFSVYPPGRRDEFKIAYDEKKSEALKPSEILARYLGRKLASDNAPFDRAKEIAKEEKSLAESTSTVNKTCESHIAAEIDWKTVQDDVLRQTNIAGSCASFLNAAEKFCDFDEGKKTIRNKVKKVTCQFGSKLGITANAGKVSWTTAKDTPNQVEFAKAYMEKNF